MAELNMRFIRRADAIDRVRHAWAKGLNPVEYLEEMDGVDVRENQHGKWELRPDSMQDPVEVANGNYEWECSLCGHGDIHTKFAVVSFCWNCGAMMDLE